MKLFLIVPILITKWTLFSDAFCLIGNPSWTAAPTVIPANITKTNLTDIEIKVLVDWNGVIRNAIGDGRDCTDNFIIKYWLRNNPKNYYMSELLDSSARQHTLQQLLPGNRYAVQVIAREDKGPIGGVDYNRSPTVYFETEGVDGGTNNSLNAINPTGFAKDKMIKPISRYTENFCKKIQEEKTILGVLHNISNFNKTDSLSNTPHTEGSKIIISVLSAISKRIDSIEHFLYAIVCSSK